MTVNAEFSESLSGSSLGQTVAHEGSHIEDDANFVNSYNPATGNYSSGANFTHRDTEFQAFEAGAGVQPYSMFQSGPQGYSSGKYLKMRAPEICKKIEEKFRAAKGRATLCCSDDIEENLKANLRKQQPEAIAVIAELRG